ncbi:MAG: hypothetical protein M9922_08380 [Microthrixaceae bacterium]|nr:hypothetical protein [Microthrixaceae bacterium]
MEEDPMHDDAMHDGAMPNDGMHGGAMHGDAMHGGDVGAIAVTEAPPERVGLLLADARTRRGLGLEEACRRAGVLDPAELMALEGGALAVDEATFAALSGLYGVSARDLVPPRDHLVVDLREGYLRAGGEMTLLSSGVGRHDVLSRYLEMVWEMRCVEPGSEVPLRDADLEVLGDSLEVAPGALRAELLRMMRERVRAIPKRRVLLGLGAAIAVVTGGVLMWQSGADNPSLDAVTAGSAAVATAPAAQLPPAPEATIGDAVVIERGGTQGTVTGDLPAAPAAEVGDAAVQERNPDGSPGVQQTR